MERFVDLLAAPSAVVSQAGLLDVQRPRNAVPARPPSPAKGPCAASGGVHQVREAPLC